ncbi:MAG: hypothetical protein OEZ55_01445 [Nitrospinota bacterium]|nr:hypothetical protein [Nitrospinota bacterium]
MPAYQSRLLLFTAAIFISTIALQFQACGGQVETPPDPVEGLVVVSLDGQNIITWNVSKGAVTYNLYWDTASGVSINRQNMRVGTKIADLKSTAYFHTGLTNGLTYYYIVTAVSESGSESEPSTNEASGTPQSVIKCPASQTLCQDKCVDLTRDANNCGACGTICEAPTDVCVSSACI